MLDNRLTNYCYTTVENYEELRKRLNDMEFKNVSKNAPELGYLCNTALKRQTDNLINYIISYLVAYHESQRRRNFKQEIIRPLSILLAGPPGVGKTSFARMVCKYLDCIFHPRKIESIESAEPEYRTFDMFEGSIAEFEQIERLGQILINLRNVKIDGNYPPALFIDEADVKPETFQRLLTMLWDGRFFWGEHRRTLGAVVIFIAVSVIRCRGQFEALVNKENAAELIASNKGCPYKKNTDDSDECGIYRKSTCFYQKISEEVKANRKKSKKLQAVVVRKLEEKELESWGKKGSDFLSRVNGPTVFIPDFTLESTYRRQIFKHLFCKHLDKLGERGEIGENGQKRTLCEQFLTHIGQPQMEPRYSTRSLELLAESVDVTSMSKGKQEMEEKDFRLLEVKGLQSVHFPNYKRCENKENLTKPAPERKLT